MKNVIAIVLAVFTVLTSLAMPPAAVAAEPAIRVAVVKTSVAAGAPYNNSTIYYQRCDAVRSDLQSEFGDANVVTISDAALNSSDPGTLDQYDVLVFTRAVAMTADQRRNVRDYAARGGGVVAMFQLANWDYVPGRTPAYKAVHQTYTPLGSSAEYANAWRWGETSELRRVKFINDPLMYQNWKAVGAPVSSHWILSQSAADLGRSSISLTFTRAGGDYNEINSYMPKTNLTPLLTYDVRNNASTNDDYTNDVNGTRFTVTGSPAGWATDYYFGRVVYYGFQLYDMARDTAYGSADTKAQALRLMINSVKWAAQHESYVNSNKAALNSGRTSFSRGTLTADHTVTNTGGLPLMGSMQAQLITPSGRLGYYYKHNNVVLPTSASNLKRWSFALGTSPERGTWKVRLSYVYWDYMRGGWVSSYRDILYTSNGSTLAYYATLNQVEPSTGRTPVGTVVAGTSRYDTASEIAAQAYSSGISAQRTAILTPGTAFQDALSASGLAGYYDAPILLTQPDALPTGTASQLKTMFSGEPSATVLIIGDTNNIAAGVDASVRAALSQAGVPAEEIVVRRIGSGDAYSRAAAIAMEIGLPQDGPLADTVIVASGEKFPDALSVSALAVRYKVPILFASTGVPGATAAALDALKPEHTLIVGGTAAVSTSVESWLETNGYRQPGVANNLSNPDSRLAGISRYDTSLEIMRVTCDPSFGGFSEAGLLVATGVNYPDALAGGPLASQSNRPLLLVHGKDLGLSSSVGGYLMQRRDDVPSPLTFLGGSLAVSNYVRGQIGVALHLTK